LSTLSVDKELQEFKPKLTSGLKEAVSHGVKGYMKSDVEIIPELGETIPAVNKELGEAETEIDRGEFFTLSQVKKQIGQWERKYAK
jgi:hypothetical protein